MLWCGVMFFIVHFLACRELYKQGRQSKWGDVLSDLQRNVLDTDVLEDSSG